MRDARGQLCARHGLCVMHDARCVRGTARARREVRRASDARGARCRRGESERLIARCRDVTRCAIDRHGDRLTVASARNHRKRISFAVARSMRRNLPRFLANESPVDLIVSIAAHAARGASGSTSWGSAGAIRVRSHRCIETPAPLGVEARGSVASALPPQPEFAQRGERSRAGAVATALLRSRALRERGPVTRRAGRQARCTSSAVGTDERRCGWAADAVGRLLFT